MEPIINPLWFYLIDVVDNLSMVSIILLIISILAFAIISFCAVASFIDDTLEEKEKQICLKYLKMTLKVIIPCATIALFTPNSTTIYKMIIADNITPHNIEVVGNTIEDSIDYIFEKINSLSLENDKK